MTRDERFNLLVLEHQAAVRAFLRMIGVPAGEVDDLAQETFVVVHRRLDLLDEAMPAGPWLRGIARNLAANHRRKAGRWSSLMSAEAPEHLAGEAEDLAARLDLEALIAELRCCLDRLPAHARGLLAARYGLWEAGSPLTRTERSPGAERQALLRIRETLRRCLADRVGEVAL